MAEGETVFTFKANTKPAEEAIDSLGDKVLAVGKRLGAATAAYFSFRALAQTLDSAVTAAMEAERATLAFNSALAMSGQYSAQASAAFQDYATELERTTGVQDELILSNASMLVSIGKLSGEGLERATKAALDLARGMQIDVASAFDIVTKATQGNVMALHRYGLEVGKLDNDSQKFAKTLDFIESRFGGLSTGAINTFEGALTKVKNGFGNIFEESGKLITSNPKVIASLSVLGDIFYKISSNIAASNVNIGKFVDLLFNIGQFVTTFLITPFEIAARWMTMTMLTLPRLMLTIYTEIAGLSDKILGTNLREKIEPIKQAIADIQTAAATPLFTEEELFSTKLSRSIDETKKKVDELATKIKVDLPAVNANATAKSSSYWQDFTQGFMENAQQMTGTFQSLGKTISGTLINGFTNAFAAMGKALVSGGNALGEFGKQALSVIGSIAIQLGQFLVLAGLGFSVIPGFQASAGAVIAGAALIVLGGVLQALGAGGSTPAAGAGGAGAVATGGVTGPSPMTEQTPEQERAAAQTGVQVVVQGNIFDSRETGLQIAQIINDSFDLNGTIIRANA
jgi:hypothetical protein